jgi:hypothetical protein
MTCDFCTGTLCQVHFDGGEACNFAKVANDNFKSVKRVLFVPPAKVLLTKSYYWRVAIATANDNRPRRDIPNWMADCLYRENVEFRFLCGSVYEIGDEDIDHAFGDDLTFRWLSDFVESAARMPKQNPHYTLEFRLRLLALSFWVDKPHVARHFAR